MQKTRLAVFTAALINVIFFIGIAVILSVPFILRYAAGFSLIFRQYYWSMVVLFLLSGILADLIFFELRNIFRTVLNGNPFVISNVGALRRMGYYGFAIAVLTLIRLFFDITPAVLVVILVFTIAGLFSLVLSQVFHQAVNYKLENDLTV